MSLDCVPFFYFSNACSIELPEMFILTGGYHTLKTVSRYSTSGWMEDLPELNEGRYHHGCGYFFNDDMQRVSIRHLKRAKICISIKLLRAKRNVQIWIE